MNSTRSQTHAHTNIIRTHKYMCTRATSTAFLYNHRIHFFPLTTLSWNVCGKSVQIRKTIKTGQREKEREREHDKWIVKIERQKKGKCWLCMCASIVTVSVWMYVFTNFDISQNRSTGGCCMTAPARCLIFFPLSLSHNSRSPWLYLIRTLPSTQPYLHMAITLECLHNTQMGHTHTHINKYSLTNTRTLDGYNLTGWVNSRWRTHIHASWQFGVVADETPPNWIQTWTCKAMLSSIYHTEIRYARSNVCVHVVCTDNQFIRTNLISVLFRYNVFILLFSFCVWNLNACSTVKYYSLT